MQAEQLLGSVGMASLTVRPLDTGVAQGLNDLPVLAANSALNVIESACSAAIAEFFETGETSFTIGAAIQMRGAVSIGGEIRALVNHDLITVRTLLEMELEDLVFLVRWQLVIDEEQQTLKHLIARNLIHVIHDRRLHD